MDKKRVCKAAALLCGLALCGAAVYLLRPPCLILQHTGLYCAGCGTQRMVTALLQGDIPRAFSHNPFMFLALPLGAIYALWEGWRYGFGKPPLYKRKGTRLAFLGVLLLAAAFTLLRNLPGFSLLGP